jgi:hypothetical protein
MRALFESVWGWIARGQPSIPSVQSDSERRVEQLQARGRMPFLP